MGKFAKAWTIGTGGLLVWIGDVTTSKSADITSREWKELLALAILTAGVWVVPNATRSDG